MRENQKLEISKLVNINAGIISEDTTSSLVHLILSDSQYEYTAIYEIAEKDCFYNFDSYTEYLGLGTARCQEEHTLNISKVLIMAHIAEEKKKTIKDVSSEIKFAYSLTNAEVNRFREIAHKQRELIKIKASKIKALLV